MIVLIKAATKAARAIYGTAVAATIAAAATTTTEPTTAPTTAPSPFAVVAQGRAPIKGDMGATPIFGKRGIWCITCIKPL